MEIDFESACFLPEPPQNRPMGSWGTLQRHYAQLRQSTGRHTSQVMDITLDSGDSGMVPTPACLHEIIFER